MSVNPLTKPLATRPNSPRSVRDAVETAETPEIVEINAPRIENRSPKNLGAVAKSVALKAMMRSPLSQ